jgi:hypothetical protein
VGAGQADDGTRGHGRVCRSTHDGVSGGGGGPGPAAGAYRCCAALCPPAPGGGGSTHTLPAAVGTGRRHGRCRRRGRCPTCPSDRHGQRLGGPAHRGGPRLPHRARPASYQAKCRRGRAGRRAAAAPARRAGRVCGAARRPTHHGHPRPPLSRHGRPTRYRMCYKGSPRVGSSQRG